MSDKFRNKYRIPSARLQNWDYSWAGAYFITICTHNRRHYFGKIRNGHMQLSPIGAIADAMWHEITNHTQNIDLGAFVVMPNHIHGILILNRNDTENRNGGINGTNGTNVETLHATSLLPPTPPPTPPSTPPSTPPPTSPPTPPPTPIQNEFMASISPKSNSVSTIIRSYKSAVAKHAHRLGFDFHWQTRFHDHIIRDNKSFEKIQTYIIENPLKWVDDNFYN